MHVRIANIGQGATKTLAWLGATTAPAGALALMPLWAVMDVKRTQGDPSIPADPWIGNQYPGLVRSGRMSRNQVGNPGLADCFGFGQVLMPSH
jgi:hypothetical protein